MDKSCLNLNAMVKKLELDIGNIRYGEVTVALRIHDGRVISVTHTSTQSTRQTVDALIVQQKYSKANAESA